MVTINLQSFKKCFTAFTFGFNFGDVWYDGHQDDVNAASQGKAETEIHRSYNQVIKVYWTRAFLLMEAVGISD